MSHQKSCCTPKPKELCWCGSGKQYRKCCMKSDDAVYQELRTQDAPESVFVFQRPSP